MKDIVQHALCANQPTKELALYTIYTFIVYIFYTVD